MNTERKVDLSNKTLVVNQNIIQPRRTNNNNNILCVTLAELAFVRLVGRFWSIIRCLCAYMFKHYAKNDKLPNHTILNFRKCYRVDLHVLRLFFACAVVFSINVNSETMFLLFYLTRKMAKCLNHFKTQ